MGLEYISSPWRDKLAPFNSMLQIVLQRSLPP